MASTTTGELLVEMSTLTSGTAMDHFTHISFGGGANEPSFTNIDIIAESGIGANDASITLTATGGTLPYEYALNNGAYQTGNSFTNLSGGTYVISVMDVSGYSNTISGITIPTTGAANIPIITGIQIGDVSNATAKDGSITIIAAGGVTPYQYSLNGGTYQSANVFNNLGVGTYSVTVKDANGVTNTLSGIKIGGQVVGRTGGYGRGWERHRVYVDVDDIQTKDIYTTDKQIKINVTV